MKKITKGLWEKNIYFFSHKILIPSIFNGLLACSIIEQARLGP
jgi:hypothetical protein